MDSAQDLQKIGKDVPQPAVWFPAIRAGSGTDVFTERLVEGLRRRGIRAEITWLPLRAECAPWSVAVPKPPAWANIVHINSWLPGPVVPDGLPLVVAHRPDVELLIVGDVLKKALHAQHQSSQSIQQAAEEAGMGQHVRFLGTLFAQDLADAYAALNVHVFPVRELPHDPKDFGMWPSKPPRTACRPRPMPLTTWSMPWRMASAAALFRRMMPKLLQKQCWNCSTSR